MVRLRSATSGSIVTDTYASVTAGEVIDASFQYGRGSGAIPRVSWHFASSNGAMIGALTGVNGASNGAWLTQAIPPITVPAGATRMYVHLSKASTGSDDTCFVTNISFHRRQAFDHLAAADIADLRTVQSNTTQSLASIDERLTANLNSLAANVSIQADQISQRTTLAQVNSAISSAITSYNVGLQGTLGTKANSNTVTALTGRVSTVEGTVDSQTQSITDLGSSINVLTGTVDGKGKVIFQSTEPVAAERKAVNLWIDTASGNNIPKRWNGTAWIAVRDKAATDALAGLTTKADASAVTNLSTRVGNVEGTLTSQGNSLTSLSSSVGQMSAGGRFRMTTEATPTGARSRIGFSAAASNGANTQTAAFFLVAESDGTTSAVFDVNRFAIAGRFPDATRMVPFIVQGGVVKMDGAEIGTATIDTLQVKNRAITSQFSATYNHGREGGSSVFTFNPGGAGHSMIIGYSVTAMKQEIDPAIDFGGPVLWVRSRLNGELIEKNLVGASELLSTSFATISTAGNMSIRIETGAFDGGRAGYPIRVSVYAFVGKK